MRAIEAAGDLLEQRNHTLLELCGLRGLQYLLQLPEEQQLLLAVGHRPILQQPSDHSVRKLAVLLHELRCAVGELMVVNPGRLRLVQGDEHPHEEQLVLLLHGQCESVDDAAEDLQQLADAAVPLRLEDEPAEDVADSLADEGAVDHELAVDAVEDGLEVLALARVPGVEEVEDAKHEGVVDEALGDLGVRVGGDDVAEEELVDKLEVGPGGVEKDVLFLGIGGGGGGLGAGVLVGGRGQAAEDVGGDGADQLLLHRLGEAVGAGLDEVNELREVPPLDLPLTGAAEGDHVGEVEDDGAQPELTDEEGLPLPRGDVTEEWESLDRGDGGGVTARGGAGDVADDDGRRLVGVGFGELGAPPLDDPIQHPLLRRRHSRPSKTLTLIGNLRRWRRTIKMN